MLNESLARRSGGGGIGVCANDPVSLPYPQLTTENDPIFMLCGCRKSTWTPPDGRTTSKRARSRLHLLRYPEWFPVGTPDHRVGFVIIGEKLGLRIDVEFPPQTVGDVRILTQEG